MTEIERTILQALTELDAAVKSRPATGTKPELLPLFARLDELTRALPANAAPDLKHFLHKKSYEKARLWLEGRKAEIARGGCDG